MDKAQIIETVNSAIALYTVMLATQCYDSLRKIYNNSYNRHKEPQ